MNKEIPYYFDNNLNVLKHPWHYCMFHNYSWYRKAVGGRWTLQVFDKGTKFEYKTWMRMRRV